MCSEPGEQSRYRNNQPSTALANPSLSFHAPAAAEAQSSVSCPLTAPTPSWAPPRSASLFNQPSLKFPGSGKTVVLSSCLHNFLLPFPSFNPSFLLCLLMLCWRLNQGPHLQFTAFHSCPESLTVRVRWRNSHRSACALVRCLLFTHLKDLAHTVMEALVFALCTLREAGDLQRWCCSSNPKSI